MDSERKGFIRVFITGCLWGTIGLFVTLMEGQGSSPAYTSFLRMLFGLFLLILLTLLFDGPGAFRIGRKTLLSCMLIGIVSQGSFNLLYSMSINMNGVAMGSVLSNTAPVFTCIMSILLFREKLNGWKWLALFVNVAGCALAATGGDLGVEALAPMGILIGVGAGFAYGMTAILGKLALREKASPFAVAAYNLLFGLIFVILVRRPWTTVAEPFKPRLLLLGLLFGLIPTALAYCFYYKGLTMITQTSKVPVVASVEVIVAILIGVFVFKENMTVIKALGILLVLFSILMLSKKGE